MGDKFKLSKREKENRMETRKRKSIVSKGKRSWSGGKDGELDCNVLFGGVRRGKGKKGQKTKKKQIPRVGKKKALGGCGEKGGQQAKPTK